MFTGIVEEVGVIEAVAPRAAGARLRIGCRKVVEDAFEGASIAVSGVCLTVVEFTAAGFAADVSPETLERSNLGELRAGTPVNLERPLSPSGRLAGHIVQGHVDGTGELVSAERLGEENWWLRVSAPAELDRYLVYKGSIAIDGVSLTVAQVEGSQFGVAVIPHTWRNTTLGTRRPGDRLNLECDIIAKYVARMLASVERPEPLTMDKLRELGY